MIVYQDERLVIFQSDLYQTNTTLFDGGDFILLVDPNWTANEVYYIKSFVKQQHAGKPVYLLFTHSDYDHIIGYRAFPGAKVIASERFAGRVDKDRILREIYTFDQQHYISRDYPIEYPEVDILIQQDGMQVTIKSETFSFYHAPGHTDDGLFTIIESAGIFIAGDYLSDLEFPFIYHDESAYLETLAKVDLILQKHPIRILVPGHGRYLKDQNAEIIKRKQRDQSYIEDLIKSVRTSEIFPLENYLGQFLFADGLRDQHSKNEEHIRKSIG